ncbi:MAG: diacylglycerol kinase family protein [Clostridiales bacterium]|jgi:diacylglycerol kinase|nr:diacylglycerol kinase family protein [Clostridiales bacterium]
MLTRKLLDSFKHALRGAGFCIKNERNFRVHLVAALTACLIAPYYSFNLTQVILLVLVIALVLICEMFNTAIEAAVDLTVKEFDALAKKAKDVSAGAVFVAALCAVICGLFLFLRPEALHRIARDVVSSPYKAGAAAVYCAASYLFVKGFDQK